MSKVIEDAAQDFAAINDDKAANSAHSYSKYDIADAYQQGADFGYSLAENRIKKEYEERLRWIPVEEKLPDISKESDIYSDVVTVREHDYYSPLAALYSHEYKQWVSYPNSVVLSNVTEWRRFL